MTENPEPQRPTGGWPVPDPVDLVAAEQDTGAQRDEQEHGERYAENRAALAWNELVLDNIRIDLAQQPDAAGAHTRALWWITGVLTQLDTVTKGHE